MKKSEKKFLEEQEEKRRQRESELFSQLCNYFWHETKDWDEDGFTHTSKECRKFACEIWEVMQKKVEKFIEKSS